MSLALGGSSVVRPVASEDKAERSLAKRRALEAERAKRIFDVKARTIGVDVETLRQQVAEKRHLKELEAERDLFYDQIRVSMDGHAKFLQQEVEHAAAQKSIQTDQYRLTFQKKESRREWDLNDPKRVASDVPIRLGDDDPRLGPASIQKFQGEDLELCDRKRAQAQQMRQWIQQQTDERDAKRWLEAERDRQYEDREEEARVRAQELELAAQKQHREIALATAEFNKKLAEGKRRDDAILKERETLQNLQEITNALESPFLTESAEQCVHAFDSTRSRPDRFKGLPCDFSRQGQAEQRAERQRLKQEDAEKEAAWASFSEQQRRIAMKIEAEAKRKRQQQAAELLKEQKAQEAAHFAQKEELRELYRGQVTTDFLDNFNQSSR
jgi:hypothetical protein